MIIHEPCFPLDPVDRICTDIANALEHPPSQQISKLNEVVAEVYAPHNDIESILDLIPNAKNRQDVFVRCLLAVQKCNSGADMNWSDVLGLVYHGELDDYGKEYEEEILPEVKKRVSLLDHIKYGHLPETRAYKE